MAMDTQPPWKGGRMKSLMLLLRCILQDWGMRCHASTDADLKRISVRVEHEGLSFLTIVLANFGSDFQKSLDQGFVGSNHFVGFKRIPHKSGGLPLLLKGFLELVFNTDSGRLLDEPNIDAIHAIRQITLMFAKMNLPCSKERTEAAIERYIKCELEVRESDSRLSRLHGPDTGPLPRFSRISTLLWADMLHKVDRKVYFEDIIPKHGPGATADKLKGNLKWVQHEWPDRLDDIFPKEVYLCSNWILSQDRLADVPLHEPGAERPVKVITVPKTLKTPRIIAIEPTAMQYMQQGIEDAIVEAIEQDDICSELIGYSSQVPNQDLARLGSLNGDLATLDLSEASDRVSNQHVQLLLQNTPHLRAGVQACRSRKADVPGFGVKRLAKFASMGSALCFPFEAMVFATVVFVGIEQALKRPITIKDVRSLIGQVRIYGDDIIVPVEYATAVVEALETFGFLVNSDKSFWTGKFRESCGKDYYAGNDVSIVRLRSMLPTRRQCVSEIISTVSSRNQFYELGMWKTAGYLDQLIEGLIPFPTVEATSRLLGRRSYLGIEPPELFHVGLQVPLVKGMEVNSVIPKSSLDDYGALLKCLTIGRDKPIADVRHLERTGRPRTVDIKTRRAPPY